MATTTQTTTQRRAPSHLLFDGQELAVAGDLLNIARHLKSRSKGEAPQSLIFEVDTGRQVDIDLRGNLSALKARYGEMAQQASAVDVPVKQAGRGRPRLGVVGREVTLLPRHWEWLEDQRGGASAALRRLVDQARREGNQDAQRRAAQDRGHRFMSAIAGNLPGFEEALRALFGGNRERFMKETRNWPKDVRFYARALAAQAFVAD